MPERGDAPRREPGERLDTERAREIAEVGRDVVGELDLDEVLRRVLEAARGLTGAQYAALGVLDADRRELQRFLTTGVDERTAARIGDLPRGHGVLGELIRHPHPLRLANVGEHVRSYGFPLGHPPMRTFLGVPILVDGEAFGNLYLTEKRGGEQFDEADEHAAVALADWASVAIGNARVHRGVRGQRDELERVVRAFETTSEISQALAGETRLDRIIELVVKRARALVEARGVILALVERDELVVESAAGELGESLVGTRTPVDTSVAGHVLRAGRPQRLPELPAELRTMFIDRLGAKSGLLVPLRFRGRGIGMLTAYDRLEDGPEFDAEDERLLLAFAGTAAVAVAIGQEFVARTLKLSIEAAERERTRWARELHDETLQDLAALKLQLQGARQAADAEAVDSTLAKAIEQVSETIGGLRALITDLRPPTLDQLGPKPALESLAERVEQTTGLSVSLSVNLAYAAGGEPTRHAPEVENTVYRLVQEALTNVVKHADATTVVIDVTEAMGTIEVTVADDGRGFDTAVAYDGFGLVGMRERAALARGSLEVTAGSPHGTVIHASIPVVRAGEPGSPPGDQTQSAR